MKGSEEGGAIGESASQGPSGGLLYDAPLRVPDQDRLGRANFAQFLARAILEMDAEEGFVFALNGAWGSGKTSVINFVLHFLEEERQQQNRVIVVRFNPWWFSGREQLLQQFFRQFRVTLGSPNTPEGLKRLGESLDRLGRILEPFTLVPVVGGSIGRLKDVFRSSGSATKTMAEALAQDVHQVRASIDAMLRKQQSRILVVIDDIDRLLPEEIRQVFQLVKAVADFPKTIYLLAFEREFVVHALRQLQGVTGEDFLEKIIQAPFDLPLVDRSSLRRLFFGQLDEFLRGTTEDLWDSVAWGNLYWEGIDGLIRTPRDVKRFVNILRPAYPIVRGEVNPVDFLGIQALRLFAPEMYNFVASHKDDLAGVEDRDLGYRPKPEERRKPFDSMLATVPEHDRQTVKDLMARLFPRWASAYGGLTYGSSWLSEWRKKRRACSPDVFDLYFMLSVPPGEISAAEMQAILTLAGDHQAFGKKLLELRNEKRPDGTPRSRTFLERIEDYVETQIPTDHIESILRAIYDVGDHLFDASDRRSFIDFRDDWHLRRISHRLLQRLPSQQDRFEIIRRILTEGKAVSLIVQLVSSLGQTEEPEEERTVKTTHLSELQRIAVEKIRETAADQSLVAAPGFAYILYRWGEWGSEEEVRTYVAGLTADDAGLTDLLAGCLQVTQSQGVDDRVSRQITRLHIPSVERFLGTNPADLLPRCERIMTEAADWLTDRRRLATETFIGELTDPRDDWGRSRGVP